MQPIPANVRGVSQEPVAQPRVGVRKTRTRKAIHFTVNPPQADRAKARYDKVSRPGWQVRLRGAIPAPEYTENWFPCRQKREFCARFS
jgi:hypothetical protein